MRYFLFAICCSAALIPEPAHTQTLGQVASYPQRPAPPTDTSIPVAEKPAAAKMDVAAPKPAVQQKIVRRPGKGQTGPVTMPSPDVLVMMVRSALAGINHANFTENYSVLHGMTTPALQARVTAAQFGRAFANLRKQNLDLSPALVLSPQFTVTPSVTSQGVLRLAGFFPSRPLQINFAIDYLPIDGFWLIDSLSVSALQAGAPAPMAGSPAPLAESQTAGMLAKPGMWDADLNTLLFAPNLNFAANSH